jgi:AraC-like DNA-binding protein
MSAIPTSKTCGNGAFGTRLTTSIAEYYRNIDPGIERQLGAWQCAEGVEFIDRIRCSDGYWEVSKVEAPGYFHFFIQADSHNVDEELNGVLLRRGVRPAGTVRVSQPEDTIRGSGIGPVRCLQVSMTPKAMWDCSAELGMHPSGLELRDLEPRTDLVTTHWTRTYVQGLALGFSGDELYFQLARQALLHRLIATRLKQAADAKAFTEVLTPARVRRIIDYIEDNIGGSLQLEELAGIAGTSKFHFGRAFANTVGVSPHVFVRQRRVSRAAGYLTTSQMPLREIARLCGFADHAHLTRTFKMHFAVSPSRWVGHAPRPSLLIQEPPPPALPQSRFNTGLATLTTDGEDASVVRCLSAAPGLAHNDDCCETENCAAADVAGEMSPT